MLMDNSLLSIDDPTGDKFPHQLRYDIRCRYTFGHERKQSSDHLLSNGNYLVGNSQRAWPVPARFLAFVAYASERSVDDRQPV